MNSRGTLNIDGLFSYAFIQYTLLLGLLTLSKGVFKRFDTLGISILLHFYDIFTILFFMNLSRYVLVSNCDPDYQNIRDYKYLPCKERSGDFQHTCIWYLVIYNAMENITEVNLICCAYQILNEMILLSSLTS